MNEASSRSNQPSVVFDLSALLIPPLERKRNTLHFLDKAGVVLGCKSYLAKERTKGALRDAGILSYPTDMYYENDRVPTDAIFVGLPEESTFKAIEDRLPAPLRAPACARVYT